VALPPDPSTGGPQRGLPARAAAGLAARLGAALGGGAVALVFSELVFLNEGPVARLTGTLAESAGALAELLLVYAALAYAARVVMWSFRARGWAGVALSGAIFGWLIEGVVIPLVYEAPPLSFLWPSLGWHLTVTFGVGWVLLPRIMRKAAAVQVPAFAVMGVAWAAWGHVFYAEDPALVLPSPGAFAALAAAAGALLIGGRWLADRPWARFAPTTGDAWAAGLLAVPLATLMAFSAGAVSLGLFAMVAATLWSLWRLRADGPTRPAEPPPAHSYLCLAALPAGAAMAFPAFPEPASGWSAFLILPMTALATLLWAGALLAALRRAVTSR
jgi:hypothetical protein